MQILQNPVIKWYSTPIENYSIFSWKNKNLFKNLFSTNRALNNRAQLGN